ncbi:VOC family protein [Mycobacterium sp. 852014-50255_SCH5639931]|uniref:VOC family protein n=1 Tax=Mycobacterium sp. 852014-50255_SCH5639931 TaxID=1834112 RepID=UPI000B0AB8EA|nr:VOC family protein [Mycobacterium sp. 852014-50255_SCH5639931]
MSTEKAAALAINHVGVTVPDIHAAIDWYGAVFGFRCIMGPRVLEGVGHPEAASVFGGGFRRAWQAHLLTGNSVGIELFQFIDPPTRQTGRPQEREPWFDRGIWHLCITHPDVQAMSTASSTMAAQCWRRPMNSCPDARGRSPTRLTPGAPSSKS